MLNTEFINNFTNIVSVKEASSGEYRFISNIECTQKNILKLRISTEAVDFKDWFLCPYAYDIFGEEIQDYVSLYVLQSSDNRDIEKLLNAFSIFEDEYRLN